MSARLPPEPASLVPHRARRPPPVDDATIGKVLALVEEEMGKHAPPVVTLIAQMGRDPFRVLIATMLSLRTRDAATAIAAQRLFAVAHTPEKTLALDDARLHELIRGVGFRATKVRAIKETCRLLLERHGGEVPDTIEELVTLPGVGRKTANLVLVEGFRKPGICVDTHVHRINNIWGYVATRTPEQTEFALRERLPRRHWMSHNRLLVAFGQQVCVPVSPKCSQCPVFSYCPRIGVTRSR